MRCEGDACDYVEIQWDEGRRAYVIRNRSLRPVQVQLRSWPAEQRCVTLLAEGWAIVKIVCFEDPFLANFVD